MLRFLYVIFANLRRGPVVIPKMRHMFRHRDQYTEQECYDYARKLMRYIITSGFISTKVYGQENLPKEGGYILYPNHQGKYDAVGIIYAHERPCAFVIDAAKSFSFLMRELVDLLGSKRLKLNDVRQNMTVIKDITKEVKEGKIYILFSEGGYNRNRNKVQEFKPGSFKCAINAKVPIVPVALIDSYKPFNKFGLRPVSSKLIFMEPIYYEEYSNMKSPEIASMVRQRIIDKMFEFGVDAT